MVSNEKESNRVKIIGVEWLKENYEGKQMAKELAVSAPFHSSLMKPAAQKLEEFLDTIEIKPNKTEYIANIDAKKYGAGTSGEIIKRNLIDQVCGSVRWTHSLGELGDDSHFIEVGPGKVLTGLNKRINSNFKTYTLDTETGFKNLLEFLK